MVCFSYEIGNAEMYCWITKDRNYGKEEKEARLFERQGDGGMGQGENRLSATTTDEGLYNEEESVRFRVNVMGGYSPSNC